MITTDAEIELERQISETLAIYRVVPEKKANWIPGMFMQLSLVRKSASEPWLDSKPFTIASWGDSFMRIIVRKEGRFTTDLFSKGKSGFSGSIRYPLGNFLINAGNSKVLLAGGAGISPFTAYLDYASHKGLIEQAHLYHSSRNRQESLDVFYWGEFTDNIMVNVNLTREQSDRVYRRRLTLVDLKEGITDLNSYEYFVCGPPGFTKYWIESLENEKLKVRSESWIVS